mmetsp:Transcript_66983/g.116591  ORF Transcript_66983/g.116591 Transcript_66983/m.116591 type:complete len:325 (+) Transcript_66983:54-1028(+)
MNPGDLKVIPTCCCAIACFLLIFTIIAVPMSFKALEQGRYALQLNWGTQKIKDEVLTEPGMKLVGLGNMLVEFPSTYQTMYFVADTRGIAGSETDIRRGPVKSRSKDGLEMSISMSFQWQLKKSSLRPLYDILGGGELEESLYRDEFVRFARAAIVESAAEFPAESFFTSRTLITTELEKHMKEAFNRPDKGLIMDIMGLQLREVDLPDAFDEEIVRTQENMQEVRVAEAEREEQRIGMERELMIATRRVQQILEESRGIAKRTELKNGAIVNQMLYYQEKQAEANAEVLMKFADDPDPYARLFEMMEIRAVSDHDSKKMLINM